MLRAAQLSLPRPFATHLLRKNIQCNARFPKENLRFWKSRQDHFRSRRTFIRFYQRQKDLRLQDAADLIERSGWDDRAGEHQRRQHLAQVAQQKVLDRDEKAFLQILKKL